MIIRKPIKSTEIVLINQFFYPDIAPTGLYLMDLSMKLSSIGMKVTVICSKWSYAGIQLPSQSTNNLPIRIIRVYSTNFSKNYLLFRFINYLSFYLFSTIALLKTKGEIFISMTTPPWIGLVCRWAALCKGGRHIHWVMDLYPDVLFSYGFKANTLIGKLLKLMTRREYMGALSIIALGPRMKNKIKMYCSVHTDISSIPLWSPKILDSPSLERPLSYLGNANTLTDLVLMYSGNMGLGHRFTEFLAASAFLGENGPKWIFCGNGRRKNEIQDYSKRNPNARITVLDYAPTHNLGDHLRSADVHLISLDTKWSGVMVPSKIQSIFSIGRPSIFVGPLESEPAIWINEAKAGWVVPPNDLDALCRAIDASKDPYLREEYGINAQTFSKTHFNLSDNLDKIAKLILPNVY
jgi:colanic acid biosynthesis glycosyl transferase WcaI